MNFISAQSLTLLATLVAVISNLLSISEKFSKIKLLSVLRIFCLYIIPILLIKIIILKTYEFRFVLTIIFLVVPTLFFLLLIINKPAGLSEDDKVLICGTFIFSVIFLINYFIPIVDTNFDYNETMSVFIEELSYKTRYLDIISYLSENLSCTLFVVSDAVTIILFFIVEAKEICEYLYPLTNNTISIYKEINIDYRRFAYNDLALIILASGMPKVIINFLCKNIIF